MLGLIKFSSQHRERLCQSAVYHNLFRMMLLAIQPPSATTAATRVHDDKLALESHYLTRVLEQWSRSFQSRFASLGSLESDSYVDMNMTTPSTPTTAAGTNNPSHATGTTTSQTPTPSNKRGVVTLPSPASLSLSKNKNYIIKTWKSLYASSSSAAATPSNYSVASPSLTPMSQTGRVNFSSPLVAASSSLSAEDTNYKSPSLTTTADVTSLSPPVRAVTAGSGSTPVSTPSLNTPTSATYSDYDIATGPTAAADTATQNDLHNKNNNMMATNQMVKPQVMTSTIATEAVDHNQLCFSMGMKSFSLLLQHIIHYHHHPATTTSSPPAAASHTHTQPASSSSHLHQRGWYEILKAITPTPTPVLRDVNCNNNNEYHSGVYANSYYVSRAVLSRLVYDMSLSMGSTYIWFKDQSVKLKNNKRAIDMLQETLENHLFVMILSSQIALQSRSVVLTCVPDYSIGVLRKKLLEKEFLFMEDQSTTESAVRKNALIITRRVEDMLVKQLTVPASARTAHIPQVVAATVNHDPAVLQVLSASSKDTDTVSDKDRKSQNRITSPSSSSSLASTTAINNDIDDDNDDGNNDNNDDIRNTSSSSSVTVTPTTKNRFSFLKLSRSISSSSESLGMGVSFNTRIAKHERTQDRHVLMALEQSTKSNESGVVNNSNIRGGGGGGGGGGGVSTGGTASQPSSSGRNNVTKSVHINQSSNSNDTESIELSKLWLQLDHTWYSLVPISDAHTPMTTSHNSMKRRSHKRGETLAHTIPPPSSSAADGVDVDVSRSNTSRVPPEASVTSISHKSKRSTRKSPRAPTTHTHASAYPAPFYCDNTALKPLTRTSDLDDGTLSFSLQILHLFDCFFWPQETTASSMNSSTEASSSSNTNPHLISNKSISDPTIAAASTSNSTITIARIRSSHMLFLQNKYSPSLASQLHHVAADTGLGSGVNRESYGSLNSLERLSNENEVFDQSDADHRQLRTMPLYFHIFRSSLYVLQTLSPLHNLATLNIVRLRALLRPLCTASAGVSSGTQNPLHHPGSPLRPVNSSSGNNHPSSLPSQELVILSLCHMLTCLQRINASFHNIYKRLGLFNNFMNPSKTAASTTSAISNNMSYIKTMGYLSESDEHQQHKQIINESLFFDQLKLDTEKQQLLHAIFASCPGRQLLDYIRACFGFFVDLIHNPVCQKTLKLHLPLDVYDNLYFFYEKITISHDSDQLDAVLTRSQRSNSQRSSKSRANTSPEFSNTTENSKFRNTIGALSPLFAAETSNTTTAAPATVNDDIFTSPRDSVSQSQRNEDELVMFGLPSSGLIQEEACPPWSPAAGGCATEQSVYASEVCSDADHSSADGEWYESDSEYSGNQQSSEDGDSDVSDSTSCHSSSNNNNDVSERIKTQKTSDPHAQPSAKKHSSSHKTKFGSSSGSGTRNILKNEFRNLTIVGMLKLLRDPFVLFTHLMRCEEVVGALVTLETVERDVTYTLYRDLEMMAQEQTLLSSNNNNSYNNNTSTMKSSTTTAASSSATTVKAKNNNIKDLKTTAVNAANNNKTSVSQPASPTHKYTEDSSGLKELSAVVLRNILSKERSRLNFHKQFEQTQSAHISGEY